METKWCRVCCTRHDHGPGCPGDLEASGTERFGWRVSVIIGNRTEHYGVLVAPAGELWRARILTFPNMLWSVPGGRGTMKFVGGTASVAEDRARQFIRDLCRAKGYRMVAAPADPGRAAEQPVRAPDPPPAGAGGQDQRYLHAIAIRFGVDSATHKAATADLSATGLFVITNRPLPQNTTIKLILEMEHIKLPLQGKVAWIRTTPEEGRQAGMGVQLINPPALYRHYVEQLT